MASKCSRFINRTSISSLQSAIKPMASASGNSSATSSFSRFPLLSRSTSCPLRRFSLSRSPAQLGCAESLLPLHSAVAAVRMTSRLSLTSRSCRALLEGDKVPWKSKSETFERQMMFGSPAFEGKPV